MRRLFQLNDGRRLLCDSQIFSSCLKLGEKQKGTGKSGKHLPQDNVDLTELIRLISTNLPKRLIQNLSFEVRLPLTKSFIGVLGRNTNKAPYSPSPKDSQEQSFKGEEKVKDNYLPT